MLAKLELSLLIGLSRLVVKSLLELLQLELVLLSNLGVFGIELSLNSGERVLKC